MAEERLPQWARRIRSERLVRRWSYDDVVRALAAHSGGSLPDGDAVREWQRWEAGEELPGAAHRAVIARTFGTVTAAVFPVGHTTEETTVERTGLESTVERLCSQYAYASPEELCAEARSSLDDLRRLSSGPRADRKRLLGLAGWLALLVGCLEYDMGDGAGAEATRRTALSLGEEAGDAEVVGWAYEMRAWYALTQGDYPGVIAASDAGQRVAPRHGVSVQLAAQKGKAWARMGDRRQMEVALDHGRTLLDALPYPRDVRNHFVVDPTKFDLYAMDCYRAVGEDRLARHYAEQIIEAGTEAGGRERSPMRNSEARVTLGVVALREGDVAEAVRYGLQALGGERRSLPSLLLSSAELARELRARHAGHPAAVRYLDRLHRLAANGAP
jgi:tetratricopeptide (TPR) repeat protein